MPQVKIKSSAGPATISYTICTPTSENAQDIDRTLPTILFLHPIYLGHVIFHFQFSNPKLRRFNLIGLDSRCHGETTGVVPPTFRRVDAAEDVFRFMEALCLPACHFFGVSLGACIALQTAVSYPEKVLSLFMLSPLPLKEPEEVAAGRQEIFDCWEEAVRDPQHRDNDALLDAIFGAIQLGFNGNRSNIVSAMTQYVLPQAFRNWVGEHLEEFRTLSVVFFVDRKPHSTSSLRQIKCPINVVHCGGDIAYPLKYIEELRQTLDDAGLDVTLSQITDAAHFGCVTHPEEVNNLFHEWIVNHSKSDLPPPRVSVVSPFENDLMKLGYAGDTSDDSDDIIFVQQAKPNVALNI